MFSFFEVRNYPDFFYLPINLFNLYLSLTRFIARTERPSSLRKKGNPVRIGNYPRNCN